VIPQPQPPKTTGESPALIAARLRQSESDVVAQRILNHQLARSVKGLQEALLGYGTHGPRCKSQATVVRDGLTPEQSDEPCDCGWAAMETALIRTLRGSPSDPASGTGTASSPASPEAPSRVGREGKARARFRP